MLCPSGRYNSLFCAILNSKGVQWVKEIKEYMKIPAKLSAPALSVLLLLSFSCNSGEGETSEAEIAEAVAPAEEEAVDPALAEAEFETIEITIEALGNTVEEMRYSKEEIVVPSNGQMTIELVNRAENPEMIHNIVFIHKNEMEEVALAGLEVGPDKAFVPDLPSVFAGSELVEPGESTEFTFTAPFQSGEYTFVCTVPGHWEKMNGRFIVQPPAAE